MVDSSTTCPFSNPLALTSPSPPWKPELLNTGTLFNNPLRLSVTPSWRVSLRFTPRHPPSSPLAAHAALHFLRSFTLATQRGYVITATTMPEMKASTKNSFAVKVPSPGIEPLISRSATNNAGRLPVAPSKYMYEASRTRLTSLSHGALRLQAGVAICER